MSNTDLNPRAVMGDNRPDMGEFVAEGLRRDYDRMRMSVQELVMQARALPSKITNEDEMGIFARLITRFRDMAKSIRHAHDVEKEPHLRAGQAVDQHFFALLEQCERRNRTSKPGEADVLQAALDEYNQAKLAAERERRRIEAERTAQIERERIAAEEKARQAAEQARLAADRARKAENIAARNEEAAKAEAEATRTQAESEQANLRAEESRIATLARPADMVRTRVDQGPVVTMATEPFAVIEDDKLLDAVVLWPFVTTAAKEQALRGWARATNYSQPMAGARVGKRPKTVLR